MFAASFLAFSTGFLSLGLEILWVRLFSFANHSLPQSFAFVLMFYLFGIALGAQLGKYVCAHRKNLWLVSGYVLCLSSLLDALSPWAYSYFFDTGWQLIAAAILIAFVACMKAIIFPIAHHIGANVAKENSGSNVAKVYVANIFGATLGPLFIGLIALSFLTTQQSFLFCAAISFLLSMYCLWQQAQTKIIFISATVMGSLIVFLCSFNPNLLIQQVAIKGSLRSIIENPYGIIAIYYGGASGDYVTGGNVYDGRTNLDPSINSNGIHRVIVLNALIEKPARVLVIGLSIGSWLKILTTFPEIKSIDVVEINPGYLQAIRDYLPQHSAIMNPNVHIYIDDGRRWLKAHPDNQYDLIVMNTTYHWRAYSSYLLSIDFLKLLRAHMRPNAVLAYNPTDSLDVFKTATSAFQHAYLYGNFLIASDRDWRKKLNTVAAKEKLAALRLDGKPLFANNADEIINRFLNLNIITFADIEKELPFLNRAPEIITDNNLLTEYKYGHRLQALN